MLASSQLAVGVKGGAQSVEACAQRGALWNEHPQHRVDRAAVDEQPAGVVQRQPLDREHPHVQPELATTLAERLEQLDHRLPVLRARIRAAGGEDHRQPVRLAQLERRPHRLVARVDRGRRRGQLDPVQHRIPVVRREEALRDPVGVVSTTECAVDVGLGHVRRSVREQDVRPNTAEQVVGG